MRVEKKEGELIEGSRHIAIIGENGDSYEDLANEATRELRASSGRTAVINVSIDTDRGWKMYRTSTMDVAEMKRHRGTEFRNAALGAVDAGQDYDKPYLLEDSEHGGPAIEIDIW